MLDVWGAGEHACKGPAPGSSRPRTRQRDFASGSVNAPSTGFHRRTILLEMIRPGCPPRTTSACSRGVASTPSDPLALPRSF
eukprot:8234071-Pyramimonas_sp.AAC.1